MKHKYIKLMGRKGKELCYPKYAPHIILGTNISYLDIIENGKGKKNPNYVDYNLPIKPMIEPDKSFLMKITCDNKLNNRMKNKTLVEVYKNASDEVKEILKTKFDNSELGIETDEILIRIEILDLIKNNIKNIRFLDKNGGIVDVPSLRFEIFDDNENWLFDINYDEDSKHFWYSYYRVFNIFESKYGVYYVKFNEILKSILEEELNLKGVTPSIEIWNRLD